MNDARDEHLTPEESHRVREFLHIFTDIEKLLWEGLGHPPGDRSEASALVRQYLERNPYWKREARSLDHLRQIQNFLTHEQSLEYGYPVAVTSRSLKRLVAIRQALASPLPISKNHKKEVLRVTASDSLAHALRLAFEKQFSQFPVSDNGQFRGLITENVITRWLGRQLHKSKALGDLERVDVRSLLREKEPDRRDVPIFRFTSLDTPEVDVMSLFLRHPALEVVLLTETGKRNSEIEGIVTQWDAARYSGG